MLRARRQSIAPSACPYGGGGHTLGMVWGDLDALGALQMWGTVAEHQLA